MGVAEVLRGEARWHVEAADCLAFLRGLPDDSVSLVCCSPPYAEARLYLEGGKDLGVSRATDEWVAWLVEVVRECVRVCTGLVALVVEGQTHDYRYSCGPLLLAADLHRAGFNLRRPLIYRRSGIPGSGGKDWFRCDHEYVLCVTRPGQLPWSDVTACGHPPRWAPGGEMSHRLKSGERVNQWGMRTDTASVPTATSRGGDGGGGTDSKKRRTRKPSHQILEVGSAEPAAGLFGTEPPPPEPDPFGKRGRGNSLGGRPTAGAKKKGTKASTSRRSGADARKDESYAPPALANPGTVHNVRLAPDEVLALLRECGLSDETASSVIDCGTAGGGRMGNRIAHQSEAPFPESLVEVLVRSFAPPGGIVCDPFSGSGTTAAVSVRWGRRFVGCDLRQSQVELTRARVSAETPPLPGTEDVL